VQVLGGRAEHGLLERKEGALFGLFSCPLGPARGEVGGLDGTSRGRLGQRPPAQVPCAPGVCRLPWMGVALDWATGAGAGLHKFLGRRWTGGGVPLRRRAAWAQMQAGLPARRRTPIWWGHQGLSDQAAQGAQNRGNQRRPLDGRLLDALSLDDEQYVMPIAKRHRAPFLAPHATWTFGRVQFGVLYRPGRSENHAISSCWTDLDASVQHIRNTQTFESGGAKARCIPNRALVSLHSWTRSVRRPGGGWGRLGISLTIIGKPPPRCGARPAAF
jgi:hypothetical protein